MVQDLTAYLKSCEPYHVQTRFVTDQAFDLPKGTQFIRTLATSLLETRCNVVAQYDTGITLGEQTLHRYQIFSHTILIV